MEERSERRGQLRANQNRAIGNHDLQTNFTAVLEKGLAA